VNPASVYVVYEGNTAGRNIPRKDLPPQLQSRYPCDPQKAEEYRQRQANLAAEQAAMAVEQGARQRAAGREILRKRELEILREIADLRNRDTENQKEINILMSIRPGNGRRVRAHHLQTEQQLIRERIMSLNTQLEKIRAQRDSIP
jgi:hypothetical protein